MITRIDYAPQFDSPYDGQNVLDTLLQHTRFNLEVQNWEFSISQNLLSTTYGDDLYFEIAATNDQISYAIGPTFETRRPQVVTSDYEEAIRTLDDYLNGQ
ncbi:MAG TPA: hypothetical protein VHO69_03435 [Phototrophicaceae bacterium]|nr:hypothetical protein [Phototrophicaceae bacterium]